MAKISGQAPDTGSSASQQSQQQAGAQEGSSARPTSPAGRPLPHRTRSDQGVELAKSSYAPAPKMAFTPTQPPLTSPSKASAEEQAALRRAHIDGFDHLAQPYASLSQAHRDLSLTLHGLLGHDEGLKIYFFEHPRAQPCVAAHARADADAFADQQNGKVSAKVKPVADHATLLGFLRDEARATLPITGTISRADLARALFQATLSNRAKKDVRDPVSQGRIVHGGTRLCYQPATQSVALSHSESFGYTAPSEASVAKMALYYANVLYAGSRGGALPRCEAKQTPGPVGGLDAADVNEGLRALAAEINAQLGALAALKP